MISARWMDMGTVMEFWCYSVIADEKNTDVVRRWTKYKTEFYNYFSQPIASGLAV